MGPVTSRRPKLYDFQKMSIVRVSQGKTCKTVVVFKDAYRANRSRPKEARGHDAIEFDD